MLLHAPVSEWPPNEVRRVSMLLFLFLYEKKKKSTHYLSKKIIKRGFLPLSFSMHAYVQYTEYIDSYIPIKPKEFERGYHTRIFLLMYVII